MEVSSIVYTKQEKLKEASSAITALLDPSASKQANTLNLLALLKDTFNYSWIGFYWVEDKNLNLGLFQGPPACISIAYNKGVCGNAWAKNQTIIVPNVHEYPGHIACSSSTNSEIVSPIEKEGEIIGVLDVDSNKLNAFDNSDARFLSQFISTLIQEKLI